MSESQHYIPQFYLKGFTDPETPKGHEPYVWIYEFESQKWKKKGPKNVASIPDYYTLKDLQNGQRYDEIEDTLSIIEGKTAKIIKDKIYNQESLNDDERAIMAEFIALMMARVPSAHNNIDQIFSEVHTLIMETYYANYKDRPEEITKMKELYEKDTGKKLPDDFDISWLNPSKYKISCSKGSILEMMFKFVEKAFDRIYNMTWTFLYTKCQPFFITSDSPFDMINPKSKSALLGHGLGYSDILVSLPLSKEICFLASWNKRHWFSLVQAFYNYKIMN